MIVPNTSRLCDEFELTQAIKSFSTRSGQIWIHGHLEVGVQDRVGGQI